MSGRGEKSFCLRASLTQATTISPRPQLVSVHFGISDIAPGSIFDHGTWLEFFGSSYSVPFVRFRLFASSFSVPVVQLFGSSSPVIRFQLLGSVPSCSVPVIRFPLFGSSFRFRYQLFGSCYSVPVFGSSFSVRVSCFQSFIST